MPPSDTTRVKAGPPYRRGEVDGLCRVEPAAAAGVRPRLGERRRALTAGVGGDVRADDELVEAVAVLLGPHVAHACNGFRSLPVLVARLTHHHGRQTVRRGVESNHRHRKLVRRRQHLQRDVHSVLVGGQSRQVDLGGRRCGRAFVGVGSGATETEGASGRDAATRTPAGPRSCWLQTAAPAGTASATRSAAPAVTRRRRRTRTAPALAPSIRVMTST